MKKLLASCILFSASVFVAAAQDSYTGTNSTGNWFTARWNNTSDVAPYTSAFTAGNNAIFTAGNYTFTGMGSASNVGNITLLDNVNVTFTSIGSSLATGGNVRTITVGAGSVLDLNLQGYSAAAGTGFIKSGAGVFATGSGTYQGGTTINAGTVIVRGNTGLGSGATNRLTLNGGVIAANATRSFDSTRFGGGIVIGGNVQFGELSDNVALASSTASLSFANNVSLGSANRTLTLGNEGTQTFSGIISNTGSGGVTFAANAGITDGRFAITGTANTFTGDISINGGEARFSADGSLGNGANDIIIDGGTFSMATGSTNTISSVRDIFVGDGTGTRINAVGATGRIIYDGVIADKSGETGSFTHGGFGTLQLGGANTYSGSTTITSGVVVVTNGGRLGATTSAVVVSGGTLDLGTQTRTNASLVMSGGVITNGTIEAGSYSLSGGTVAAALAGSGGLTKTGAGTMTLTTANSYQGATSINEGALRINGDMSLTTGLYTVAANAAIGGSGTIGGSLSFLSDAKFIFSLTETLTVNGSSVTFDNFGIDDLVGLNSGVALGTYTLINGLADIDITNLNNFGEGNAFDLGEGKSAYFTEGSLQVNVVPEPSTYALLALSGLALAGYAARCRRR
jgi:autotransporter-associated beta strand protein